MIINTAFVILRYFSISGITYSNEFHFRQYTLMFVNQHTLFEWLSCPTLQIFLGIDSSLEIFDIENESLIKKFTGIFHREHLKQTYSLLYYHCVDPMNVEIKSKLLLWSTTAWISTVFFVVVIWPLNIPSSMILLRLFRVVDYRDYGLLQFLTNENIESVFFFHSKIFLLSLFFDNAKIF